MLDKWREGRNGPQRAGVTLPNAHLPRAPVFTALCYPYPQGDTGPGSSWAGQEYLCIMGGLCASLHPRVASVSEADLPPDHWHQESIPPHHRQDSDAERAPGLPCFALVPSEDTYPEPEGTHSGNHLKHSPNPSLTGPPSAHFAVES